MVKKLSYFALIGVVAAGISLSLVHYDRRQQARVNTQLALTLARQAVSQLESLSFFAREKGEADPIQVAIQRLSQGAEPRIVRIQRWNADSDLISENYVYTPKTGTFEYTKVVFPLEHLGVKIKIELGYTGFLGAKSIGSNDISIGLFFIFSCFLLSIPIYLKRESRLQKQIEYWVTEANSLGQEMAFVLKELMSQVQSLVSVTQRSRDQFSSLRERVHSDVREVTEGRGLLMESERQAKDAELLAMNLLIQSHRQQVSGDFKCASEDLFTLVCRSRKLDKRSLGHISKAELHLEPIVSDLKGMEEAYEEIYRLTRSTDQSLRKAYENKRSL